MSLASDKIKILEALKFYQSFLKNLDEVIFAKTPPSGGWSYAEVYSHILSANFMSGIAMDKCLNKTAEIKTRKPHWKVRLILFLGRFPPGKLKAPEAVAAAVTKISKEDASNKLIKSIKKFEGLDVNLKKLDVNYKMKHPRLGYLDAASWLRFILIHTKHHQKQLLRVQKELNN